MSYRDVQTSLALFAEAIAEQPTPIALGEDRSDCWPWTLATPGAPPTVPPARGELESYRLLCRSIVLHRLLTAPPPARSPAQRGPLFAATYAMVEDIRATAQVGHHYPGAVGGLGAMFAEVRSEPVQRSEDGDLGHPILHGLRLRALSLHGDDLVEFGLQANVVLAVSFHTRQIMTPSATAADSEKATIALVELINQLTTGRPFDDVLGELAHEDDPALATEGTTGVALDGGTPTEYEEGEGVSGGQLLGDSDGQQQTVAAESEDGPRPGLDIAELRRDGDSADNLRTFLYDEWDCHAGKHRRAWCRVIEEPLVGDDHGFLVEVRVRHQALRARIRGTLTKLRPQELVRVYRSDDGDEVDLDAAIEAIVNRRTGAPADDRLHIRRDRAARDVATAFLVDLSASTSSPAVPPEPEPVPETDPMDDPLSYGPLWQTPPDREPVRRVIDVAKDAVALMGDALDELGDRYAIYGFSGTGRDHVEFKVGKDFSDRSSTASWAAVAAMKPLRYTRMGPAIRHATAKLAGEPARTKLLIVISDGYPQDTDYGLDRHDRDYAMFDTARALADASDLSIETFCVTIDPAGHDYLRRMCPDDRYLVIDDVESLPEELAKLYLLQLAGSR